GSQVSPRFEFIFASRDPATEPMPAWGWGVPGGPYKPPAGKS
ncbi:MAG: globin, partial [Mesorhizobium sp.]